MGDGWQCGMGKYSAFREAFVKSLTSKSRRTVHVCPYYIIGQMRVIVVGIVRGILVKDPAFIKLRLLK